jgi:putative lipoic acid-binding regulatory protein
MKTGRGSVSPDTPPTHHHPKDMPETPDEQPKKPVIEYPCEWPYKVIAEDGALTAESITEELRHKKHAVALSNRSNQGKYVSFAIEATVQDEEERSEILRILQNLPGVKMVI